MSSHPQSTDAPTGHFAVASTSGTSQHSLSQKGEYEKLTNGGRVLVVGTLDGNEGLKGGKGRRRGRFIILVDEGEERRRWVPWILLALLIVAVGIATYFIVTAAGKETDSPTISNSSLRRAFEGNIEKFRSCGGGESPLIARLRDTAKLTTIQHFAVIQSQFDSADTVWVNTSSIALSETSTSGYSHDIIVPTTPDANALESDGESEASAGSAPYAYAVSGTELIVLWAGQNTSVVVESLDFASMPSFQSQKQLTLMNETSTIPINTGLATFRAKQILLPSSPGAGVLLVIGSAVGAAPVIPGSGPTPNIVVGEATTRSPSYTHLTFRPFDTTVIITVNIEQPDQPVIHSVSEHEGQFVTATEEKDNWAWVFIRASAHVSAEHDIAVDSELDDNIMPLFRSIAVNTSSELEVWQTVGACTDVSHLQVDSKRDQDSYMLVSQPVNLNIHNSGAPTEEESVDVKPELFVMGWSSLMQPVLPARSGQGENVTLKLFLTEAIAAGSQATTSISSAPSSTTSTGAVEASSTLTALIRFSLSEGKMNSSAIFGDVTKYLEGDTGFMGAMHFLPETQQLSLLLTETLDENSDESLRSAFYLYNTTAEFAQEYNRTELFRDRSPTSIVYLSDTQGLAAAFVGFAFGPAPLVQVIQRGESGISECVTATANCGSSVQRLFAQEQVSLMKGFNLEMDNTKTANILLVAGRTLAESNNGVATTASPPGPAGALAAASTPAGNVQFSLYSYFAEDPSNRMEFLTTASIASGRVLSEAFQDARAAQLFHAPSKDDESALFFALPVSIVEDAAEVLEEVGCTGTKGFSGTFIWKIDASVGVDGSSVAASVVRVAAVPSTGTCGRGFTSRHEESMVKRMRFFGEGDELQFVTISNCHTASVPWSAIVALIPEDVPGSVSANATSNTTQPQAEDPGELQKVQVTSGGFSTQCGQQV